jgi:CheY-like chemotaxis protein
MSQSLAEANSPLRVLVVDDEELARMRLKSLVAECDDPSAVVVGEAANAALIVVTTSHLAGSGRGTRPGARRWTTP